MFVRSPAAYEALKGFNLLQLPSRAILQAYTGAFIDDLGKICMDPVNLSPLVSCRECEPSTCELLYSRKLW